jgi:hypothetical protein
MGVLARDLVLQRRRHQDVAIQLQPGLAARQVGGAGELEQRPGLLAVRPDLGQVEALGVVDGSLVLHDADQDRARFLEETAGVIADVAQTLHHHPLAGQAAGEAERLHVLLDVAGFARGDRHAAPGRLGAPADAAQGERLAGDARRTLQLVGGERHVGVHDPGHLPRPGAEVRRRHVDARSDEVLLDQLEGIAAGDALELLHCVLLAVDGDAALGAAERHVHDGALVGHQRGQRHDLVLAHRQAVADAALGRQLVVAVLGPPGVNHLDRPVRPLQGIGEVIDAVAVPDQRQQVGVVAGEGGGLVEVPVDLIAEADRLGNRSSHEEVGHSCLCPLSGAVPGRRCDRPGQTLQ